MKKTQSVQYLIVDNSQEGRRIDNFLSLHLKGIPKSRIYQMLRKGEVRINGKRAKPQTRLSLDDQIRVPPVMLSNQAKKPRPSDKSIQMLEQSILYEDENLLVINKPSGITVHAGSHTPYGIIEILKLNRTADDYLELAHRLDRETSGCLLIAKQPNVLKSIHQALQSEDTEKNYLALMKGSFKKKVTIVNKPLKKNTLKGGERLVKIDPEGKIAISEFSLNREFSNCSLSNVIIKTGRTHQIRVHAAYLGNPLAQDKKYGDKEFNMGMKQLGLHRIFLHAERLVINLPEYPETVLFRAPLAEELAEILDRLN